MGKLVGPGTELPGSFFDALVDWNCPGCYAWFRNGVCLYVGASVRIAHRLATHEVVKPERGDSVQVWRCADWVHAEALETKLTLELRPLVWLRGRRDGPKREFANLDKVPPEHRELAKSLRCQ